MLALTGTGSFYGKTMSRGLDLAAKHIEAGRRAEVQVHYIDHKSGDAGGRRAGHDRARLARASRPSSRRTSTTSGAMLAGDRREQDVHARRRRRHEHLRPGPAVLLGDQGDHAERPDARACSSGSRRPYPDAKTVGLVGWDIGEPNNGIIREDILKKIADAGYEFNDLYELVPVGGQDFSQVLPKIKANEPDILLVSIYGQDPGSFANQAATAGLTATRIGFEFTPDGVNASKGTYDSDGYTFAYDYFDAKNPAARWPRCSSRSSSPSTARIPTSTPPTSTRTRS